MFTNCFLDARKRSLAALGVCTIMAGCVGQPPPGAYREPELSPVTRTQQTLRELPFPVSPVPVAVYAFADQTGQFELREDVQSLSRAVTQGGASILAKALRDAGDGNWFTVLEREGVDNLLRERQIIREMRLRYLGEQRVNPNALPPLLFAGVLLEGGIVGFDSNTLTGGVGARFMGIGGDVQYRQSTVTVNLRAVSVRTGEILANVSTSKTIASVGGRGGAFRFVDFDELLEIEAGITNNEPDTMAVRRAIEKAVYSLILEGSETGLWRFRDQNAAASIIAAHRAELERGPRFEEVNAASRRPDTADPGTTRPNTTRAGAGRAQRFDRITAPDRT